MMAVLFGIVVVLLSVGLPVGLLAVVTELAVGQVPWGWLIALAVVMLVYSLFAAGLESYDLTTGAGWVMLVLDLTWSLPNTVFGALIGLWLYPIFGNPNKANSAGHGWVCFMPRGGSGFGTNVLQTLGTVNLGGAGQHERMHLMQARLFGPLYLPLFAVFYVITFLIQGLFTLPWGLILKAAGVRSSAHFNPPSKSAVQGYFGWIYYATPFEVWAYASGNP